MKFYTIFFEDVPVYEGNDGRYWLGGSAKLLNLMVFKTKKAALQGLDSIIKRIQAEGIKQDLFYKNLDKLNVARFEVKKFINH